MTDDGELRARIEARVAARRAGAASPESAHSDAPLLARRGPAAEPGDAAAPAHFGRRAVRWLLARRPADDADAADAAFTLPEGAAAFDTPWPGGTPAPRPDGSRSVPARRRPSPAARASSTRRPTPGARRSGPDGLRRPDLTRLLAAGAVRAGKHGEQDEQDEHDGLARDRGGHGRRRWLRTAVRLVVIGAIVAATVVLLRTFVVQPYYIPSESMEPTLHGCKGCNDDHVLVDKISYRAHDVHPGDIVVFHRPKNASTDEAILIKRVIATAGDVLQLRQGEVLVDGRRLDEPYLDKGCGPRSTHPLTSRTRWKIPSGDVFVMGDNRCDSYDSRAFGPIPTSSIVGRAFAIIWPLNRLRSL